MDQGVYHIEEVLLLLELQSLEHEQAFIRILQHQRTVHQSTLWHIEILYESAKDFQSAPRLPAIKIEEVKKSEFGHAGDYFKTHAHQLLRFVPDVRICLALVGQIG